MDGTVKLVKRSTVVQGSDVKKALGRRSKVTVIKPKGKR